MEETIKTLCRDCLEVGTATHQDMPNHCRHCGSADVGRLPSDRCPDCGLPADEHDPRRRGCPDRAYTRNDSPDGHVTVMRGERVGRRRADY